MKFFPFFLYYYGSSDNEHRHRWQYGDKHGKSDIEWVEVVICTDEIDSNIDL
jgi:hypothetical protein